MLEQPQFGSQGFRCGHVSVITISLDSGIKLRHYFLPEIEYAWNFLDNILVVDNPDARYQDLCIIYFSGNGVFSPHTSEQAKEVLLTKDYFEWQSLDTKHAARTIFVRDVYKQWYLRGISKHYPNQNSVLALLKQLSSQHARTRCIGNSAGGYAAVLFGVQLVSELIISVAGQFDIPEFLQEEPEPAKNPIVHEHLVAEISTSRLELFHLLSGSTMPILYLYPGYNEIDKAQALLVSVYSNIIPMAFAKELHGKACYEFDYKAMLYLDLEKCNELRRFERRILYPWKFSVKAFGIKHFCIEKGYRAYRALCRQAGLQKIRIFELLFDWLRNKFL
jgi:hypothetical protein